MFFVQLPPSNVAKLAWPRWREVPSRWTVININIGKISCESHMLHNHVRDTLNCLYLYFLRRQFNLSLYLFIYLNLIKIRNHCQLYED